MFKAAQAKEDIDRTPVELALCEKFNENWDTYVDEIKAVIDWLRDDKKIKVTPGMTEKEAVDYFRGIHFHHIILLNKDEVLEMIPTLKKNGFVT